jgi:septal ring factor EnvC (AmiA/AmiB activator)
MDYSITQSTNIRQLEAKVTQLESERASLLTSQDALTARIESLRARVAEHDQEREAAAKARSDAALSSGKPLTPAERLTAPVSIVAWQAIAAVVGAFVIGAVLF